MKRRARSATFARLVLVTALTSLALIPTTILAGGKTYPIEGTVRELGTTTETTGGGNTTIFTHVHRTYTVKTPDRVFVLECPYDMEAIPLVAPRECGGKKKIAIGDVIHFRVEKDHAYVVTAPGEDQRLRVVSEALNEAGNAAPVPSAQP